MPSGLATYSTLAISPGFMRGITLLPNGKVLLCPQSNGATVMYNFSSETVYAGYVTSVASEIPISVEKPLFSVWDGLPIFIALFTFLAFVNHFRIKERIPEHA